MAYCGPQKDTTIICFHKNVRNIVRAQRLNLMRTQRRAPEPESYVSRIGLAQREGFELVFYLYTILVPKSSK